MILQRYISKAIHISRCSILKVNTKTYSIQKYSTAVNPRKFSKRHEWVTVEKDIGTVGISKYAQESLGDVVFAQPPDPGTVLKADDECGALESVKAASELYTPVSGVVTEKNKEVESRPSLINSSCYEKGWLFKIKLANVDELKDLMTEEQYDHFIKTTYLLEEK